jgi:predicted MPP superfamily phosphohydrolase
VTVSRSLLRIVLTVLFFVGAGLALDAFWLEPDSLRLTRYNLRIDAPVLKGLRIAVISDLHAGAPYIDGAKIDRVVAMTNAARPDLIVLTGDYVITISWRAITWRSKLSLCILSRSMRRWVFMP